MTSLTVIATLRTCYTDKFGVPRQSGLVPAAWGIVEFTPAYRRAERCAASRTSVTCG